MSNDLQNENKQLLLESQNTSDVLEDRISIMGDENRELNRKNELLERKNKNLSDCISHLKWEINQLKSQNSSSSTEEREDDDSVYSAEEYDELLNAAEIKDQTIAKLKKEIILKDYEIKELRNDNKELEKTKDTYYNLWIDLKEDLLLTKTHSFRDSDIKTLESEISVEKELNEYKEEFKNKLLSDLTSTIKELTNYTILYNDDYHNSSENTIKIFNERLGMILNDYTSAIDNLKLNIIGMKKKYMAEMERMIYNTIVLKDLEIYQLNNSPITNNNTRKRSESFFKKAYRSVKLALKRTKHV